MEKITYKCQCSKSQPGEIHFKKADTFCAICGTPLCIKCLVIRNLYWDGEKIRFEEYCQDCVDIARSEQ